VPLLFNRWQQQPYERMQWGDVDGALQEAAELGSANLKYVWEDSRPAEKVFMAALARSLSNTDQLDVDAVGLVWRQAGLELPEQEVMGAVRSLLAREVIVGEDKYRFAVDLQRLWVEKHRRLEWLKDELADSLPAWQRTARNPSGFLGRARRRWPP
jgi:hypothetical protein